MATYDLGTARGTIIIDGDTKGVDKAQQALERQKKSLDQVGTGALVAGGVIAGGLAVAVNAAANFEQRLSAIQAVSGETAQGMQAISDKALQIGKDTSFSATEAASAIEELAKAGVSTTDILSGAADATVALAAAGEISLPQAATIASNAMNQFGLAAEDMPNIADKIAGAANASAIDVGEFGMSLSQAGAVANLAGMDFDDLAVAIAEMGNAGIKGSDAGTSLKSMLMNLQPTTEKQIDLMRELGLITADGTNQFFDQTGKLRDLSEIQGLLAKSLKGMSDQQKTATLETLFGSDAIRAASVLAANGAKGYDQMAASMGKVGAQEVAQTRLDNMKGSLEQLKGSIETASIQLGQVFLPVIRKIIDGVNSLVGWFLNLDDSTKRIIAITAGAAAAFLLAVGALIKIVKFVAAAKVAFAALTVVMNANPFVLIATAILALIAVFVTLYNTNDAFRKFIQETWKKIQQAVKFVVDWFQNSALPVLKTFWENVTNWAKAFVDWFQGSAMPVITTVIGAIVAWFQAALPVLKAIWDGIYGAIEAVVSWFMGTAWPIIKTVVGFIIGYYTTLFNVAKTIFNGIVTVVRAAVTFFQTFVMPVLKVVFAVIGAALKVMFAVFKVVFGLIKAIVTGVVGFFQGVVMPVFRVVFAAISQAVQVAWAIMQPIFNLIKTVIGAVIDFISGTVVPAFQVAWDKISTGLSFLGTVFKTIFQGVILVLTTAGAWILDSFISPVVSGFLSLAENILGAMTSAFSWIPGIGDALESAKTTVADFKTSVESSMDGLSANLHSSAEDAKRALAGAPVDGFATLTATANTAASDINTKGGQIAESLRKIGSKGGAGMSSGLRKGLDEAANRIDVFRQKTGSKLSELSSTIDREAAKSGGNMTKGLNPKLDQAVAQFEKLKSSSAKKLEDMGADLQRLAASGGGKMNAATKTKLNKALAHFTTFKGQVNTNMNDLASDMRTAGANIGADLSQGIASGIASNTSSVATEAAAQVRAAEAAARAEAQTHSPSKVWAKIGRDLSLGLRKGILDGQGLVTKEVRQIVSDVVKEMRDAKLSQAAQRNAEQFIESWTKRLQKRATSLKNVIDSLKKKQDELASLKDARSNVVSSIQQQVSDTGNIVNFFKTLNDGYLQGKQVAADAREAWVKATAAFNNNKTLDNYNAMLDAQKAYSDAVKATPPPPTYASVKKELDAAVESAKAYYRNIKNVAGKTNEATAKQLLQDLVSSGDFGDAQQVAAFLAKLTPEQLAALAAQRKQISDYGAATGNIMANDMYQAGIAGVTGLINGLKSKQAELTKAITALVASIVDKLRRKLKIASPSKVMEKLGDYTMAGYNEGLLGQLATVQKTMGRLGTEVPSWAVSGSSLPPRVGAAVGAGGAGAASGKTVILEPHIYIGDQELTDLVDVRVELRETNTVANLYGRSVIVP